MTFRQILTIIAIVWLILINLTAFIAYGVDKRKAVKGQWRIPEATLIGLALAGGPVGAYAGMKVFHHKTKHAKFTIGVPAIMAAWVAAVIFLLIHNV
ncbi:MAG: DUF1294 domain-containing protein [[Bacteroides] pectinophilus]|nr:DUF1294 domain-containing protein [[Bacteroides] pectinophilus]